MFRDEFVLITKVVIPSPCMFNIQGLRLHMASLVRESIESAPAALGQVLFLRMPVIIIPMQRIS